MKAFLSILLSCLISLSLSAECNPGANHGVSSLNECKGLQMNYPNYNQCCMIRYVDTKGTTYNCCYEMSANIIVHFEQNKAKIKDDIDKAYPGYPNADTIKKYECSSKYLKISILALILVLF